MPRATKTARTRQTRKGALASGNGSALKLLREKLDDLMTFFPDNHPALLSAKKVLQSTARKKKWPCCPKMGFALDTAIIRTIGGLHFGLDVMPPMLATPLSACPWCGREITADAIAKQVDYVQRRQGLKDHEA